MTSRTWSVCVLTVAAALSGCGSNSKGLQLATVTGAVKYRGQPLENAQVVFIPEAPGVPPATGTTDKSGRYQLMTLTPGDGAVVGKCRVSVTARGPDKVLPEGQSGSGLPGGNTEPGDPLIPIKYFLPDTSGLTAEVTQGGKPVDFDLKE